MELGRDDDHVAPDALNGGDDRELFKRAEDDGRRRWLFYAHLQRMVRKTDAWRGYCGDDDDSPTDAEAEEWLQQGIDAIDAAELAHGYHRNADGELMYKGAPSGAAGAAGVGE